MSEIKKMLMGSKFNAESMEIRDHKLKVEKLLIEMRNSTSDKHQGILKDLLGSVGENTIIKPPFNCEFGKTITVGNNTFINMNVTILDGSPITIGNNVLIGPGTGLYGANHPLDPIERRKWITIWKPIIIEDDVWIGGNVSILPNIRIGKGSIVGSGSVVTKDVPPMVVVAGNPARIIKEIKAGKN